jgi:Ca2+-binding RTX toxin-like protein
LELSGDTVADLRVSNAEDVTVALGAGSDIFSARGGALSASHLVGTPTTMLDPVGLDLTIDGGEGADTLNGGDGDDRLTGGEGNDLFKTHTSADGADEYVGGAGTDKLDYGTRAAAVTAVADGATSSGEGALTQGASATEGDAIATDIEDLAGGSGDDYLVGNALPNRLTGNAGSDWLSGGPAGDCSVDLDTLEGGAGDDRFLQGSSPDCSDALNGGAGVDRADYQERSGNLVVTLEGVSNDGEVNEADNVKTDVEQVLGGGGDDALTGSGSGDELHGGPGNDVLSGGAGDDTLVGDSGDDVLNGDAGSDTFLESGTDAAYDSGSEPRGAGDDTLNGGTPTAGATDRADYSQRSATLTITLCTDVTKAKGGSTAHAQCTDADGAGEADSVVNVQHLLGGSGDDTLKGHTGDDTVEGGDGADTLSGGAGNDRLFGDGGDDELFGDAGDDYLDGVAGADALDGDRLTNAADGDVCVLEAGDSAANCEL